MKSAIVDSCILLDLLLRDATWQERSSRLLALVAEQARLIINQTIYAEVGIGFASAKELDKFLESAGLEKENMPFEAAYIAAEVFRKYREHGGKSKKPLNDFYIAGHALVRGHVLLTRDYGFYKTYFKGLEIAEP